MKATARLLASALVLAFWAAVYVAWASAALERLPGVIP